MNPRTAKKIKMTMNTKTPIKMLVAIFFLFSIACCEFFAGPGRIPDMIFFFGEKKSDCLFFFFFASRFFFCLRSRRKLRKIYCFFHRKMSQNIQREKKREPKLVHPVK